MTDNRSLRTRIFPFKVTIPSGTPEASPVAHALDLPWTIMEWVELTIPRGHVGGTGIAFLLNGQQLLPWPGEGRWIIGDGQSFTFATNLEINTGFSARGYNLGSYDHSFYVRLKLNDLVLDGGRSAPAALLAL